MTSTPPTPLNLVRLQVGRVLKAASSTLPPPDRHCPPYDPVFLPDDVALPPDQAQELRYGAGRGP